MFTIGYLIHNFTLEEILSLRVTQASLKAAIEKFGIELVQDHLGGMGIEIFGYHEDARQ